MKAAAEMRPFESGLVLGPSLSQAAGDSMASEMATSLAGALVLMFVLLLLLFVLACRPWRFFPLSFLSSILRRRSSSSSSSSSIINQADDIERPLFSETSVYASGQSYDFARDFVEESSIQIDGNVISPRAVGLVNKKRVLSTDFRANQVVPGDSLVLDVTSDALEVPRVGQTLKHAALTNWPIEDVKHVTREDASYDGVGDNGRTLVPAVYDSALLRSSLTLEVIAGPSHGLHCSRLSTNTSMLPLILGRVSPSDLMLKDSEVSGKHAIIDWNINSSKWVLVDMGSLNGTSLNSQAIHHPDSGSRHCSKPVELANGDIITLGSSSKISIMQHIENRMPFGVGVASDPMAIHRGGKQLPMEDMCYCQWPLTSFEQFGLFCIFDGHGGAGVAKDASKLKTIADQIRSKLQIHGMVAGLLFK